MHTLSKTLRHWATGIRLYIAIASLLVTGVVIWWAQTAYGGTTLYPSRVEETFAWLATGLLVLAISIGPFIKLFPNVRAKGLLFDSRRMIGISAAWFATLHASIAYSTQFKLANPFSLPALYQRSFIFGAIAFVILFAMVATSFDAAFRRMGVWWFRLHRFVYIAVIAVLVHAFLTGVHATQLVTLSILSTVAVIFIVAYGALWSRNGLRSHMQRLTAVGMSLAVIGVLWFGLSQHHMQMSREVYGLQR